ncbi:MAG TPA: xanthine dehydrogenase family protein molybdopterin-binding subunit [Methylomirabilota bacterium]|nr:xanthine dehydrogenase family protein molybdopterin-binding subunit [Methylomirabilota bacterium]
MAGLVSIGQPTGHVEGPAKVTGRALYTADILAPGLLWGKCLRSPFPHARILSIDVAQARQLPGVHAVLTGADLPEVRLGRFLLDIPVLARDRVRFIGEKVAAVAAESPDIAEEALTRIDVQYEELPAVFDPLAAMQDQAPLVHEHPDVYTHPPIPEAFLHGGDARFFPSRNVVSQVVYRHGDLTTGFTQADRIFAHTFSVPSVHQGYIEPHACVVSIEAGDKINVWLSDKTPFLARGQFAAALGVSEDRVRVNPVAIGGDFGGKGSLMDSVLCYYLALHTGRPVKMVMTYAEELMAGNPRHAAVITLRTGVTRNGLLTARQAKLVFNCGAYGAFVPLHTVHGGVHAGGPYRIPHIEIECLRVYTNTVPAGHMRAPGAPQTIFAVESHMDMMAHELGLDPLEFRLRNALVEGDASPLGERWRHIRCKETLLAAAQAAGWETKKPPYVGRGIGMYDRAPGAFGPSSATLSIDADARLTLLTGAADTGTGSYTVLQQIVVEELQAPLTAVTVVQGDTDTAAYEVGAGGSRLTHTAGQATLAAAQDLKQALLSLAAQRLGCAPAQVQRQHGCFVTADGRSLDLVTLMAWAAEQGAAPLSCTGSYVPKDPVGVTSFCAQVAEVEVDPETGQVQLRKLVTAHDVGTVINPLTHQGQIEGGVVQGIGQALTEHLQVQDGAVTTLHLGDYKLPTAMDIPELTTVLVESKAGPAPYAGKAVGELSNVAVPAAIANAVFAAVGVRLMDLPVAAEKVYAGLRAKGGGK